MNKIYVIEEKSGFRSWQPKSADAIRKGATSKMDLYRILTRIYKLNKVFRIRVYIPL